MKTFDYARLRRALLFEFWGLFYFRCATLLPLAVLGIDKQVAEAIASSGGYFLMAFGLALLTDLQFRRRGLFFLGAAGVGVALAGGLHLLSALVAPPEWAQTMCHGLVSVSALFFLLALRELGVQEEWHPGVMGMIGKDILFISTFWIGTDAFVLALTLFPHALGWRGVLGGVILLIVRLVAFCHLWLTLQEIHRIAGIKHNVKVIRSRRRAG